MSQKSKTAHVSIDIDDVRKHGGISAAIAAWCDESDDTECGTVGSSFSTSGPGNGWSIQHDENDFARRAFEGGALYYLDNDTGRLIEAESADDAEEDENGELPNDVYRDIAGGLYRIGDWSDDSVVEIVCPSLEDALAHPAIVAEMAQAVIDHHKAESDCSEWRSLIETIRAAAEAIEDIDADDFE